MKDNTERAAGRKMVVERLAIVVSSIRGYKLLAIPKIANGAGRTIADWVYDILGEWNLIPDVRALCFDATSSNTAKFTGSASILETLLPNPVLFCACRHHIAELLLGKAFEMTVEPVTSAPTIGIFQRFQNEWPRINVDFEQTKKNSAINDVKIQHHFPKAVRTELIEFAREQMAAHHERADYRELAHLMLLFLGEIPLNKKGVQIKFKAPGAVTRARFMGKAIYSPKIYLFRDQFVLTGTYH